MFQSLLNLSLFSYLLICVSADSFEVGRLSRRHKHDDDDELSKKDYKELYEALSEEFISAGNIPKYVRMSFHDLLNFDKSTGSMGAQGCILDDERIAKFKENRGLIDYAKELKQFVEKRFPKIKFPSGDIVSLAGKVAVEKAFPCLKIEWSYGRKPCTGKEQELGPSAFIETLAGMQPFLNRYGLSAIEMATLTCGAHGVAGSVNQEKESNISDFTLARVSSGVNFIQKTANVKWKREDDWYGLASNPTESLDHASNPGSLGRFFTDMLFFPTTLLKIKDVEKIDDEHKITAIDESNALKTVEKKLLGYDNESFNNAFGKVFAKMLLIGTEGTKLKHFSDGSSKC